MQRGNAIIGFLLIFGLLLVAIWYFTGDAFLSRRAQGETVSGKRGVHMIEITDHGFFPYRLVIRPGDTVTFVNRDSREHHPFSDPDSRYGFCPGLDSIRPLVTNETFSGIFEQEAICVYRDKLNGGHEGRIIVEQP